MINDPSLLGLPEDILSIRTARSGRLPDPDWIAVAKAKYEEQRQEQIARDLEQEREEIEKLNRILAEHLRKIVGINILGEDLTWPAIELDGLRFFIHTSVLPDRPNMIDHGLYLVQTCPDCETDVAVRVEDQTQLGAYLSGYADQSARHPKGRCPDPDALKRVLLPLELEP